jgi:hypothetical protein
MYPYMSRRKDNVSVNLSYDGEYESMIHYFPALWPQSECTFDRALNYG